MPHRTNAPHMMGAAFEILDSIKTMVFEQGHHTYPDADNDAQRTSSFCGISVTSFADGSARISAEGLDVMYCRAGMIDLPEGANIQALSQALGQVMTPGMLSYKRGTFNHIRQCFRALLEFETCRANGGRFSDIADLLDAEIPQDLQKIA